MADELLCKKRSQWLVLQCAISVISTRGAQCCWMNISQGTASDKIISQWREQAESAITGELHLTSFNFQVYKSRTPTLFSIETTLFCMKMSPYMSTSGYTMVKEVWICIMEHSDVEDIMTLERWRRPVTLVVLYAFVFIAFTCLALAWSSLTISPL